MEWLNKLVESILKLIPTIRLVTADEMGIRATLGTREKILKPGWYFHWPIFQWLQTAPVVLQIIDLRCQSVTSRDGHCMLVSGALQYVIRDIRAALLAVHDYDQAIQRLSLGAIQSFVARHTKAELTALDLETHVINELDETVLEWGIDIGRVFITDLSESPTYRVLLGDGIWLTNSIGV